MKRLGLFAIPLLILLSFSGMSTKVLAQSIDSQTATGRIENNQTGQTTTVTPSDRGGTNATPPSQTSQEKIGNEPCSINPIKFDLAGCLNFGTAWIIKNTFLQIAGFLVWLCANMLNYAIQISILGFSKWAPDTLYPIWVVIRQIVSLVVVFAGLYLGFMYIIGREDTFAKYVGWLMVFALFVNFSYPVSRAFIDVSNIISLNIYASAVGSDVVGTDFSTAASTSGANTAGALIMNRLGLQGLVGSATEVKGSTATGVVSQINSTPGALIAVVFVLYAAYIFFMATAIIATRTAILVFLTIASPLLLIDSVVPKLGEVAMKMRKMFFEQLVVAPVFMIMLALTLKFMEVFQAGGALNKATSGASLTGGAGDITTFFSILMMLIMLHIMLKVTKNLAGEAGQFATNTMGKVGGFGLAAATAGTGLLARGTIGQLAAGARDSQVMDRWKNTAIGRGAYGLTNSLANSTFDTRNIGMVSKGLASAGISGGLGLTMQQGSKQTFEASQKAREERVLKFGSNIRDDATRSSYFKNANTGFVYSKVDENKLKIADAEAQEKKDTQVSKLVGETDAKKRELMIADALANKDFPLADKLKAGDQYLAIKNTEPDAPQKKADLLKKMGINVEEAKAAEELLKKDPFEDINKAADDSIKNLEDEARTLNKNDDTQKKRFNDIQTEIGKIKNTRETTIKKLRKDTLAAFVGIREGSEEFVELPLEQTGTVSIQNPGGSDFTSLDNEGPARGPGARGALSGPGSSNMSATANEIPAYQRTGTDSGANARALFATSFAENMRRGGNQGGASSAADTPATPKPNTPSPAGEAVTA